jgi:hypothetical protein
MVTRSRGELYSELTAPNPFQPSGSMMIGTWRSSSGALLILQPDGSFSAPRLLPDAGEPSYGTVPIEGSGRWHVGPVSAEPPGVVFDFSLKVQMELLVERLESTVVMYYDKGDPDKGVSGQYQFSMVR